VTATIDRSPPEPAGQRPQPTRRRRPPAGDAGMPAGRALQIMLGALLTAMVFNSAAMVRAGEGMEQSRTRTLILAVGRPVHTVAHALWLDRPRRVLGWAFGEDRMGGGRSPLLSGPAAPNQPPPTSVQPTASTGPAPAGPDTPAPATRAITAAEPLRLLVTGDSMTEFLGPSLIKALPDTKVTGRTVTRYGTGLVRPDFFDWSHEAERLMKTQSPEAVVVMMGGNDGQGIRLSGGKALPDGSAEWAAEYQRRAGIVMRTLTAGGARRVYWVSMPVPRSARLVKDYAALNRALSIAATGVPGVRYVDVTSRLSAGGRFADYLPDDSGHTVLARARDGIHLSRDGARIAAAMVRRSVDADWHL
jgi:hypothetical protein